MPLFTFSGLPFKRRQTHKMVKHTQTIRWLKMTEHTGTIRRLLPTNCSSVFDQTRLFVILGLNSATTE